MKKIEVQTNNQADGKVCVEVDLYCNHADNREQEIDCGYAVYRNGELDFEDDWRWGLVCNKCEAVNLDGEWDLK